MCEGNYLKVNSCGTIHANLGSLLFLYSSLKNPQFSYTDIIFSTTVYSCLCIIIML